jgi:hypothetical protein
LMESTDEWQLLFAGRLYGDKNLKKQPNVAGESKVKYDNFIF